MEKNGGSNKFKGKWDKTQSKKSWVNPQKYKVDDKVSKSPKRGEGNSYQKDKHEKKNVQYYNYEKWHHLAKNCFYKKDKRATKGKDDEGENLARQDSYDLDGMVLMVAVADEHVDS